jgi:hypothetical protein
MKTKKINYKKLFLMMSTMFLFGNLAIAQYDINLILSNRPPAYLSDWYNPIAGQLLITSPRADLKNGQVKISTQLVNTAGELIAKTNNATAEIIYLTSVVNVISLDRVLQLENMVFVGPQKDLTRSGKLDFGQYFLQVKLIDPVKNTELSKTAIKPFTQVSYQLPYLLSPNDKTWLNANSAQTAITFRWSNTIPTSFENTIYRLQVYQILEGQSPMQALRSNQPILLTDVNRSTQYIWRPQLALRDSTGHQFIWTVQTLDAKGFPFATQDSNNQGLSEPRIFGVTADTEKVNTFFGNEIKL